ncbi:MAG: hypothetical protein M3071_04655, partial [Actinomycetota bacterium]|nr:hypothetical protein [Actinomycetota bacterium]
MRCDRVPQGPPPGLRAGAVADASPDDLSDWPLPPFWFEDPALRQPTEAMAAVMVDGGVAGEGGLAVAVPEVVDPARNPAPTADAELTAAPEGGLE